MRIKSHRFHALICALALGMGGCGGGGLEEGVPKNVDMSKDYTPLAKTPLINYKEQLKAKGKAKSVDANPPTSSPPAEK